VKFFAGWLGAESEEPRKLGKERTYRGDGGRNAGTSKERSCEGGRRILKVRPSPRRIVQGKGKKKIRFIKSGSEHTARRLCGAGGKKISKWGGVRESLSKRRQEERQP